MKSWWKRMRADFDWLDGIFVGVFLSWLVWIVRVEACNG